MSDCSTASRIVLASRPQGAPSAANFRLEQVALPALAEGEVLLRNRYLSLDPYMRGRMDEGPSYAAPVAVGAVMEGQTVAEVLQSKAEGVTAGELVLAPGGGGAGRPTRCCRPRRWGVVWIRPGCRSVRRWGYMACPVSPPIPACMKSPV